jgi:glycerol-3-phosphate dehydrogenase
VSGNEFETFAKVVVINAAGPFCDSVRKMANSDVMPMICPSSGVHIVLPDYYSPEGMGLIVPKTKDGRVVFMLPWLGRTVAGTTDSNTQLQCFLNLMRMKYNLYWMQSSTILMFRYYLAYCQFIYGLNW